MEQFFAILAWATANGPQFISAVNAVLFALIALCLLIPGSEPEATLQKVVDFLAKFSVKPKV